MVLYYCKLAFYLFYKKLHKRIMKTRYILLFILSLLVCIVLPAVLLSNPTSATGGQLRDIQGIRDKVLVLESGFDWLKFLGQSIFAFLALFAGFVFFLFTRIDSRIDKLDSRIDKMETNTSQDIKEIRTLLMQLIQNTSACLRRQGKKQSKHVPAKDQAEIYENTKGIFVS